MPVAALAEFEGELEALTLRFAGEDADAAHVAAAREIAEATIEVKRVRAAKLTLVERLAAYVEGTETASAADVAELMAQLMRLDRYERRALSKQKSAVRRLDALGRVE